MADGDDATGELRGAFGEFRSEMREFRIEMRGRLVQIEQNGSILLERVADHEARLRSLEDGRQQRRDWWRQALQPIVYVALAVGGWLWGRLHIAGGG